jgi:hypothetical protein
MQPIDETERNRKVLFEHETKTCLGHVTNTNGFSKRFKPALIMRFGCNAPNLSLQIRKQKPPVST